MRENKINNEHYTYITNVHFYSAALTIYITEMQEAVFHTHRGEQSTSVTSGVPVSITDKS